MVVLFQMYTRYSARLILFLSLTASGATLYVGPGGYNGTTFARPCAAVLAASDGDTVLIDAVGGPYKNDTCSIPKAITIRGFNGRPHIEVTNGDIPDGKAIWTAAAPIGKTIVIDNLEISGSHSSTNQCSNCAAIRRDYGHLVIRNSYLHDSDNGLLSGPDPYADVLLENTEVAFSGGGGGLGHNIYITQARSFTMRGSYSHNARVGHLVKSRAMINVIEANRLTGEFGEESYNPTTRSGTESLEIDLPIGGTAFIKGNIIQQGGLPPAPKSVNPPSSDPQGGNANLIAFAEECTTNQVSDPFKGHWQTRAILAGAVTNSQQTIPLRSADKFKSFPIAAHILTETHLAAGLVKGSSTLKVTDGENWPAPPFEFVVNKYVAGRVVAVSGTVWTLSQPWPGGTYYKGSVLSLSNPEEITITGKTGDAIQVLRHVNGTTALPHSAEQYVELDTFDNELHVVNNTIVSDFAQPYRGGFVLFGVSGTAPQCAINQAAAVRLVNNVLYGPSTIEVFRLADGLSGPQATIQNNFVSTDEGSNTSTGRVGEWFYSPMLTDDAGRYESGNYDYHLIPSATGMIGQGATTRDSSSIPCGGPELPDTCGEAPALEYRHPAGTEARSNIGDIGAYAYAGGYNVPSSINVVVPATLTSSGTGKVTVNLPSATQNGVFVTFESSAETVVNRPPSVFVPPGQTQASSTFKVQPFTGAPSVTISAYAPGMMGTSTPMRAGTAASSSNLSLTRETASGPHFFLNLDAAPTANTYVSVTSSNPSAIYAPGSVLVPAGQTKVALGTMTGSAFSGTKPFTLSVAQGSQKVSYSGNASAAALALWNMKNGITQVTCGSPARIYLSLTNPAPVGGAKIPISSDKAASVPAYAAQVSQDQKLTASELQVPTVCASSDAVTVGITASFGGVTKTLTLKVLPK